MTLSRWLALSLFAHTQELRPTPATIVAAREALLEALRVRYSSPLFRLPSGAAVGAQLRFHNTGPMQARTPAIASTQMGVTLNVCNGREDLDRGR